MTSTADDIHAALRQAILDGTFAQVSYPGGIRTTSDSVFLQPKTIMVRPISSRWSEPERNKSRAFRERSAWQWQVEVAFDREVSVEEFEDSVTSSMLRILRSATKPQVDLIFEEASYRHPPEQQPAGGTSVVWKVRAEMTPL